MKSRVQSAFTLIELLLAFAVLSLLLILLAQAVGAVQQTWLSGVARIDNFSKARVILGMIDRDLQSAVLRPDLAAFLDENGNPACAFYTQISGVNGNRRLSLVRYSQTNFATNAVFRRADYGLDFSTNSMTLATTNKLPDLAKAVEQEVAEGVLRFEWQFVAADGTFQPGYRFDYTNPEASSNTRSVIISLLALDDRAIKIGSETGKLDALLQKFSGTPATGQTYASLWNAVIQNPSFSAGLPAPLTGGVRVFERHYPLH
ncbi:MAG: hypothetical protein BGO12_06255 [Verrucomicrobia bacterium 61-8]|nr:prepilin-type N-terminal cleavage/methylation domain-containing protein [Verrucomicrobiota bacterium]OJV13108.1 MAG: hypothetical protein BGO12_06255 [Verrucomicrobia bacterium 61-8]